MSDSTIRAIDAYISGCLRGDQTSLEAGPPSEDLTTIIERIRYHGVQGLLYQSSEFRAQAAEISGKLSVFAMADAISEEIHKAALGDVFIAFKRAGIPFVVLKGTAVAYLLHQDPATRPRCDTDLIVPEALKDEAGLLLEEIGCSRPEVMPTSYQQPYKLERHGLSLGIDLHWRAANSEVVSRAFEFEFFRSGAQSIPKLHQDALAPSLEKMLCFSIMHFLRDAEYQAGARLIWLHDMSVISQAMDDAAWRRFFETVRQLGLGAAVRQSLELADQKIGGVLSDERLVQLKELPEGKLSRYLSASGFKRYTMEFFSRPPLEALRYLRNSVLPPSRLVHAKYGTNDRRQLLSLYYRRALDAAFRPGGRSKK